MLFCKWPDYTYHSGPGGTVDIRNNLSLLDRVLEILREIEREREREREGGRERERGRGGW